MLALNDGHCSILIHQDLNDQFLDRLHFYLEDGRNPGDGLLYEKDQNGSVFYLYLRARACSSYVEELIKHYPECLVSPL